MLLDLSILVVNYCTYKLTRDTIQSIIDNTGCDISYEIIVVDNNSPDGSIKKLEENFMNHENIRFIEHEKNSGFAVANNIAFRHSSGDYILLLNSDVVVYKNSVDRILEYIKNRPDVGAVGCRVLLEDGSLDKASRRSFPTPMVSFYRMCGLSGIFPESKKFNRYNLSYMDDKQVYEVDCLTGACMLIRRDVYIKTGGLDEDYFMYGEDIDLCYRIKQAGYKIVYYGKTAVTHYKGASGKNRRLLYEFHNSMQIFYDKHYRNKYNSIVNHIIKLGIWTSYYAKLLLSYL